MSQPPPDQRLAKPLADLQKKTDDALLIGSPEFRRFDALLKLLHLIHMNKITGKEYSSLYSMVASPDLENLVVVEEIIKEKCK